MRLQPFDLLCVSGNGRVSSAIRWATSSAQNKAAISHVSFCTGTGDLYTAYVQEALWEYRKIVRRPLGEYVGTGDLVAIYRPLDLDDKDRADMQAMADATVGRSYGFRNIGLQLIDAMLTKLRGRPVRFARRWASTAAQICSENVSEVWQKAGKSFGVEPGTATPDDIYDFVTSRPDKYRCIRPLETVPARVLPFGYYLPIEPEEVA